MKYNKLVRDIYGENETVISDIMEGIMGKMKGYDTSYLTEIIDEKGNFSHEKLKSCIDNMLYVWKQDLHMGYDRADEYIEKHEELYRSYLYVVMRCMMFPGLYEYYMNIFDHEDGEDECPVFERVIRMAEELEKGGVKNLGERCYEILVQKKSGIEEPEDTNDDEDWRVAEFLAEWEAFFRCAATQIMETDCDEFMTAYEKLQDLCMSGKVDNFYQDIKRIVDIYLVAIGKSALLDVDKTMDLYDELFDVWRATERIVVGRDN